MTLLDLLSALRKLRLGRGEGSFEEAVRIVTGDEDPFTIKRAVRDLEGLSHATIDRENRDNIHVLAPRLIALPRRNTTECEVVLAGARNDYLIQELYHLVSVTGVKLKRDDLWDGLPQRISLSGTGNDLKEIARKCTSLPLEMADDLSIPDAWHMLASAPYLQSFLDGFKQESIGYSLGEPEPTAKVFNADSGYYDPWSRLKEGYRSKYILWRKEPYDFRLFWWQPDEEHKVSGQWRQRLEHLGLESSWGRWAVACSADIEAHPSISGEGSYKVAVKTPLPMELHRVCCHCSGFPPEKRDGFYVYRDVPPVIQYSVSERLMVKTSNSRNKK